jgi:hypothetical protein
MPDDLLDALETQHQLELFLSAQVITQLIIIVHGHHQHCKGATTGASPTRTGEPEIQDCGLVLE